MSRAPTQNVLTAKMQRALKAVASDQLTGIDPKGGEYTGERIHLPQTPPWLSYQQLADFARIMATPARRARK